MIFILVKAHEYVNNSGYAQTFTIKVSWSSYSENASHIYKNIHRIIRVLLLQ